MDAAAATAATPSQPSAPSFTHAASQAVQATQEHVQYAWNNVKSFVQTRSITFWIVFGVAMLTLLGLIVYYLCVYHYLWYRYIDGAGSYQRYLQINADICDRRSVLYQNLTQPTNGYTYSMWLYVANWYSQQSYNKWKIVYCRAERDDLYPKCKATNVSWNTVPNQQPGVWLGKSRNFLRVVVTTQVAFSGCGDSKTIPSALGSSGGATCLDISNGTDTPDSSTALLEYADLEDIPIGEWFQVVVVVTAKRMELYLNGQLAQTYVFVGSCDFTTCTTNDGYFAPNVRYQARMTNFRYMPLALPVQMVRVLHDAELSNPVLRISNPLDPSSSYDQTNGEIRSAWW